MTQAIEKIYTSEEYLELEVVSEERREYINGKIRLMRGTPNHNKISSNLLIILKLALRKRPYEYLLPTDAFGFQNPMRSFLLAIHLIEFN